MANEQLVQAVKRIVTLAKAGSLDDAYAGYRELFSSPAFLSYRPEDQRQALKLMILAKGAPRERSSAMIEAHRSALPALNELVAAYQDAGDYEMLGVCHVILGNEEGAGAIFRAALAIERERNAGSDLCGSLMKRVSEL